MQWPIFFQILISSSLGWDIGCRRLTNQETPLTDQSGRSMCWSIGRLTNDYVTRYPGLTNQETVVACLKMCECRHYKHSHFNNNKWVLLLHGQCMLSTVCGPLVLSYWVQNSICYFDEFQLWIGRMLSRAESWKWVAAPASVVRCTAFCFSVQQVRADWNYNTVG